MVLSRLRRVAFRVVLVVLALVGIGRIDGWLDAVLCGLAAVLVMGILRDLLAAEPPPPVPQDPAAGPTVRIDAVGPRWVEVVKAVRGATGLGLLPVKEELEREPERFVVRSAEDAEELLAELERRGAVAVVEAPGGRAGFGV